MAIKLYTCDVTWLRIGAHHCWRVERELKAKNIEYEAIRGPLNRSKRERIQELTGQKTYPVIQLEDGSVYKAPSREMAASIRAGTMPPAASND